MTEITEQMIPKDPVEAADYLDQLAEQVGQAGIAFTQGARGVVYEHVGMVRNDATVTNAIVWRRSELHQHANTIRCYVARCVAKKLSA